VGAPPKESVGAPDQMTVSQHSKSEGWHPSPLERSGPSFLSQSYNKQEAFFLNDQMIKNITFPLHMSCFYLLSYSIIAFISHLLTTLPFFLFILLLFHFGLFDYQD
jgi:hypothetical protein